MKAKPAQTIVAPIPTSRERGAMRRAAHNKRGSTFERRTARAAHTRATFSSARMKAYAESMLRPRAAQRVPTANGQASIPRRRISIRNSSSATLIRRERVAGDMERSDASWP